MFCILQKNYAPKIYTFYMYPSLGLFNPLKTKSKLFHLKTQFVPRSKHFLFRLKNKSIYVI
jgi:hypothetical protein